MVTSRQGEPPFVVAAHAGLHHQRPSELTDAIIDLEQASSYRTSAAEALFGCGGDAKLLVWGSPLG